MEESFNWVLRAITGSTNSFHIECCKVLVDLYELQYNAPELAANLASALREQAIKLMVEV